MTIVSVYHEQVLSEINALPEEYLPFVLLLVRTLRESITLKPAADSVRQGWYEAQQGLVMPVETLWQNIEFR